MRAHFILDKLGENIIKVKEIVRVKNQTTWLIFKIQKKFKRLLKRYGPNGTEIHRRQFHHMLTAEAAL